MRSAFVAAVFLLLSTNLQAAKLTIVKAGPVGELATLAEANEVRVVFSEPMVALGKIPRDLSIGWFHIEPKVAGSFRWAGTTTLIFTPDPKQPLPYAMKFDVTVDADAKSLAGNALEKTTRFSFTTPTIQLRSVSSYHRGDRWDAPLVILLRFNQPVDAKNIVEHLQLRTRPHEFKAPEIPAAGLARLRQIEPQAVAAFEAKKQAAAKAAASDGARLFASFTTDWDRKRFPPGPDLVALETRPGIAPDTTLQVYLDSALARGPLNARTGKPQEFSIATGNAFFVARIGCVKECDPETRTAIELTRDVDASALTKALTVTDITDAAKPVVVKPREVERTWESSSRYYSLDELGYSLAPARTYGIRIDPSLGSTDGQPLGYTWMAVLENWHRTAFISFGDGQGVWESDGGPLLPFHARNFRSAKQWLAPVSVEQVVPAILALEKSGDRALPPGTQPVTRTLAPVPDKIQSYGVDVRPAIGAAPHGIVWVAVQNGEAIPQSRIHQYAPPVHATLVQVTNLGISVKDSPQNAVILVTRLDSGAPVAGAAVTIRTADNKVFWSGATDATGLAVVPRTNLRLKPKPASKAATAETAGDEADESWSNNWRALQETRFVVFAEKEGDLAYAVSNWHDGVSPFDFGLNFDLGESEPLLRGTLFTDRGVYKLGEEVHAKAIVRSDTPQGMQLLPAGTKLEVIVRDSHNKEIERRALALSEWSSAEWTLRIPADAPLGTYRITAAAEGQRLSATGEFLVAAYRRPDFRVDVSLTAPSSVAGTPIAGGTTARYLFGAPMATQPAKWTWSRTPLFDVPQPIRERWPEGRYSFLGSEFDLPNERTVVSSKEEKLDAEGKLELELPTSLDAGRPYSYELESQVADVSRQQIAGRASFRVDPAPWYVGMKTPPFFSEAAKGFDMEIVVVGLDGIAVPEVPVAVELHRIQWNSVRRAEGNGFYTWDTERKVVPAGSWNVTSAAAPLPLHVPTGTGGLYELVATAREASGRWTSTTTTFYVSGEGYTAWERYDHNRIDLVTDKRTYRPGETASVLIKSPWEQATALVTTEREGVRTWRQFTLASTQTTLSIPVTEADIPNVYVSVLLVKGRSREAATEDESDPGKPSFRLGYAELKVEDTTKRLQVSVKANRDEYRPASKARVEVEVRDRAGNGTRSEVTLWAVDYGVLSLTGYRTPDVVGSVYLDKALQVVTVDSREKIISRRVLTPKGAAEGGGGGRDAGAGTLRKDFRVLAFWLGSMTTDSRGRARADVALPESLTTYRIMAVAADQLSRFGAGQNEIRINKPLLLTPAYPRFLAVGDKALFGAVVHSQLPRPGKATVTITSTAPGVIAIAGEGRQVVDVGAKGSAEVRFEAIAKSVGTAPIRMTVSMDRESDAFEDTIPVRVVTTPETVAAYGSAGATTTHAEESLEIPSEVVRGFGGLHVDVSSTAMVGLAEGARYLVEYPYGCAEQRASATLALMLAAELGDAFKLPGIDAASARTRVQSSVANLERFQCDDGGFAFWPGDCTLKWPYLTAYVTHVLQRAQKLGYAVEKTTLENAYGYLDRSLGEKRPSNEGFWPSYTANQAFAVKVLAEGGRNVDSHVNRLIGVVDRMPVFGIAHLADALEAKKERSARLDDLQRRISNAILPEAGSAHVEELADPTLLWFWSSNVRSTAIVLGTLVRTGENRALVEGVVRWLMHARTDGRWGNTQENAWALESLVDYFAKFESETPDFVATVNAGSRPMMKETFRGRSSEAKSRDLAMPELLAVAAPGASTRVTFDREGAGTLFYALRLRYARSVAAPDAIDHGFAVERRYELQGNTGVRHSFNAGDLIKVTLRIRNTKERRYVAVTDPIPAGTEPVEAWFATTASELAQAQAKSDRGGDDWQSFWRRGGFDFVERHDDRVNLFATRLGEGAHEFTYLLRATTSGTFVTAPLRAEEMYEPEVFGTSSRDAVEVKP